MATRTEARRRHARRRGQHPDRRILPPDRPRSAHVLDRLVLNGRWLRMQIGDRLLDAQLERTTEGASTVTLTVWDGDRAVSRSGVFGDRTLFRGSQIRLDGLLYRITGISRQGDQLTVTFEDAVVADLKNHGENRPVRVSRGVMTRAQFCAFLLRQAGAKVIVLDEHVIQPVKGAKQLREEIRQARRESQGASSRGSSQATGAGQVYPKHSLAQAQANPDGYAWLSTRKIRAIYEAVGFTPTEALHMAQISHGESGLQVGGEWRHYPGIVATDGGIGLLQITPTEAAWGSRSNPVWSWLAELGGATAMRNPVQNALMGHRLFKDGGYRPWHGTRHLNLSSKAAGPVLKPGAKEAILAGGREGGVPSAAFTKDVAFDRKHNESTWTACKRLLDEVRWRMFVREGVVVIASDPALMRAVPSLLVKERSEQVETLDFDWHRALRVGEMTGRAYVQRWSADPGEVIDVDGLPPIDRRWLLASIRVSLLRANRLADITLKAPQQPLKEPAPELETGPSVTGDVSGEKGSAERLYQECKRISDAHGPYVFGGGHGAPLANLRSGQGLDCSSSTSLALYRAGLFEGRTVAMVSGQFASSYGKPGRGKYFTVWAHSGHVFIELHGLGDAKRFDTSPGYGGGGGSGPSMRTTSRPTAGFTARHIPGL